nr:hypothetical protein [Tanacetum cinerariifolium]
MSHVLEEEPTEKPKRAKKPIKKSTTVLTAGVVIRDTPSESILKKKTPAKVVRRKGMDLLSDVALLEAGQLKKTFKKSKLETQKLHASGLGDGVGSQLKVSDEQEDKTTGTDEGTDSGDDESNDEVTKDDDDDVDSDADGDKEANDREKTNSNEDKNPNLNQNDDDEEEYVRTPDSIEFNDDDEEYEELYKDTTYEQVKDDEHVILTTVHDTQITEVPLQSSPGSSDFANQFLNLDYVLPTETKVVSMMNVKVCHEEPSTQTLPLLNIPVTVIL